MKILAIESSCDETAAAVVEDGAKILSNVVVSQIDIFKEYGGVIPEVAARSHLEVILPVVHKALGDAGLTKDEIDYIAVTHTPGLLGSLLIGTLTARMLAILWGKPLYAVHHLKSHIYANWLLQGSNSTILSQSEVNFSKSNPSSEGRDFEKVQPQESSSMISKEWLNRFPSNNSHKYESSGSQATMLHKNISPADSASASSRGGSLNGEVPKFPLLALVVSGGHTQIIRMEKHNQFEIIGTTRDDAVGECFDKVAKILGLPYPGGPSIDRVALGQSCTSSSEAVTLSSSKDSDPRQPKNPLQTKHKTDQRGPIGDASRYRLPHPKVEGLDFSFSGLKTAVLRAVQVECGLPISTPSYELKNHLSEAQVADFAAAFQKTACDILIEKLKMALREYPETKSVVIAGGVSASKFLRQKALDELSEGNLRVFFPELKFSGDNAAMVGAAAYYEIISGVEPTDPYSLSVAPRAVIG